LEVPTGLNPAHAASGRGTGPCAAAPGHPAAPCPRSCCAGCLAGWRCHARCWTCRQAGRSWCGVHGDAGITWPCSGTAWAVWWAPPQPPKPGPFQSVPAGPPLSDLEECLVGPQRCRTRTQLHCANHRTAAQRGSTSEGPQGGVRCCVRQVSGGLSAHRRAHAVRALGKWVVGQVEAGGCRDSERERTATGFEVVPLMRDAMCSGMGTGPSAKRARLTAPCLHCPISVRT